MFISEQQTIRSLAMLALWTVLTTCLPAAETALPADNAGPRVARKRLKQDLPLPEFERLITAPGDVGITSSSLPANEIIEGGVVHDGNVADEAIEGGAVVGTPGEWIDGEIGVGNDFIARHDTDGSWMHEMPLLQSSGSWLWRGHWYTEQALVAMYRSTPHGKILTRDPSFTRITLMNGQSPTIRQVDNQDPLQSDGQTFRAETGVKLTIGNIVGRDSYNRDHAIEFTFWGFFDFAGRDTITATEGPGTNDPDRLIFDLGGNGFLLDGLLLDEEVGPTSGIFQLPISIVGFSNARTHAYLYESDLNSYELNLRTRSRLRRDRLLLQPSGAWHRDANAGRILTLLGGMRVIRHNERFLWNSIDGIDSQLTNAASGIFESRTHNDMFGLQLGAGIQQQRAHWNWGIKTTAGMLYNFANRSIRIETNDLGTLTQVADDASDDQAVVLGEAGAYVGWHIRPHVTLKASYDALYYTGIAVARDAVEINGVGFSQAEGGFQPGQITDTFRPLELRHNALYHALSMGFEVVW